jgi:hypothetical protein
MKGENVGREGGKEKRMEEFTVWRSEISLEQKYWKEN